MPRVYEVQLNVWLLVGDGEHADEVLDKLQDVLVGGVRDMMGTAVRPHDLLLNAEPADPDDDVAQRLYYQQHNPATPLGAMLWDEGSFRQVAKAEQDPTDLFHWQVWFAGEDFTSDGWWAGWIEAEENGEVSRWEIV